MLFQYTPLASETIRLVRFLPYSTSTNLYLSLEHAQGFSSDRLRYTALTYHPDNSEDRKPITLGGRSFLISAKLFDALSAERKNLKEQSPLYFVEHICINQRNPVEKEQQARLLPRIISSAHAVNVWLGPLDDNIAAWFNAIESESVTFGSPKDLFRGKLAKYEMPGLQKALDQVPNDLARKSDWEITLLSANRRCDVKFQRGTKNQDGNL